MLTVSENVSQWDSYHFHHSVGETETQRLFFSSHFLLTESYLKGIQDVKSILQDATEASIKDSALKLHKVRERQQWNKEERDGQNVNENARWGYTPVGHSQGTIPGCSDLGSSLKCGPKLFRSCWVGGVFHFLSEPRFIFIFSIMAYYRILNIVPCVVQCDLVVYPFYI